MPLFQDKLVHELLQKQFASALEEQEATGPVMRIRIQDPEILHTNLDEMKKPHKIRFFFIFVKKRNYRQC